MERIKKVFAGLLEKAKVVDNMYKGDFGHGNGIKKGTETSSSFH